MLISSGHSLVTDFGVAKAVGDAAGAGFVTTAGIALGTPSYMAPEQAVADREVDQRADRYAVGVMGYELLAGRLPFVGATVQQVVAAHLTQAPKPLGLHRPTVPPALAHVIMRALEKRPADRWQSAGEMLARLEPFRSSGGEPMAVVPPPAAVAPRRSTSRRWIAGGLLLGAAALALWLFFHTPHLPESRFGGRVQLTLDPGLEIDPAISPDGRFVAYAAGTMAELEIRVRQVDGGAAIALARALGRPQRFPFWSPDGRRIMFRSPRGIEMVPALGGAPRLVVPERAASGPDQTDPWGSSRLLMPAGWLPRGDSFAFLRADSLYAVGPGGGEPRLVAQGGEMHSFAWSPDGRWIACVRGNRQAVQPGFFFGNRGQSAIWLLPASGGPGLALSDDRSFHATPSWLPGGRSILCLSNQDGGLDVYHQPVGRSGRAEGPPRRLTTGLNARAISLAANGARMAYSVFSESSNIWSLPVPTGRPVSVRQADPVTRGNQVIEGFDLSRDGRWLAFDSDRSGNSDIYRQALAGGEPEQLTQDSTDDYWPRWSPDGREIAFHAFREGRRHLFLMAADGSARRQLTSGAEDNRGAGWSPDGRTLFYTREANSPASEVRSLSRNKGDWGSPRTVFRGNAFPAAVTPDGQEVAFTSGGAVLLVSVAGDAPRILVARSERPTDPVPAYVSWSTDGRTLYYLAVDGADHASIWAVQRSGGRPRLLVRFDDPTREWHRFGFGQSHGRFYFTLGDRQSDIWTTEVEGLTR